MNVGFGEAERTAAALSESRRFGRLPLRARQSDVTFGSKDVAIEIGDPLTSTRGNVEIAYGHSDLRRDVAEAVVDLDQRDGPAIAIGLSR
jgi:hypothetical protein